MSRVADEVFCAPLNPNLEPNLRALKAKTRPNAATSVHQQRATISAADWRSDKFGQVKGRARTCNQVASSGNKQVALTKRMRMPISGWCNFCLIRIMSTSFEHPAFYRGSSNRNTQCFSSRSLNKLTFAF